MQQILSAARTASHVGASCSGIHDQLAVSTTEAAQIVSLVNEANREELHGILATLIDETVVANLVDGRRAARRTRRTCPYHVWSRSFAGAAADRTRVSSGRRLSAGRRGTTAG